jgi:hypothetical protein
MKIFGYHFCQISQNATPIFQPIVSSTWINLCIFYYYFLLLMFFSNILNILLCYFKNTYQFKNFFLYILCTIASKDLVYKYLLTFPARVCSCFSNFKGVYRLCFRYIELGSIGKSLNLLEPIVDCSVGVRVMSFKSIVAYPWNGWRVFFTSYSKSIIAFSMCGGGLSSSFGLLVM